MQTKSQPQDNLELISRHCLNKDIIIYQHDESGAQTDVLDYDRFCEMINYWKVMLVDRHQARPGQTCLLDFSILNAYYYSALFAAAELGLVLIVDLPHAFNESDIHNYKTNMHGKIDFIISQKVKYNESRSGYNKYDILRNAHIGVNIVFQEDFDSYTIQNNALWNEVAETIYCTGDSPLIYSASSGTTGLPKKIVNSHRKVYLMAQRLGRLLSVESTDRVLHTRNIHHGASMCYHFLPGFMFGREHYTYTMRNDDDIPEVINFIEHNQINQLFLYTSSILTKYLHNARPVTYPVKITTLYQITLEAVQLLKQKGIKSIKSPFGDTTIGLGFFVKTVDQNTDEKTYDVTNMGPVSDEFFLCELRESRLYVSCPTLGEDWQTSNDLFELVDGNFYFKGRANNYRINHDWIKLNELEAKVKELFGHEGANIVVDQEMQKIYLAIWQPNEPAEQALTEFFETEYEQARISYVLRNELFEHFYNSRKIDNSKIREVCRTQLGLTA
jgi:acyl-CoA synthetase (AMP-forming)/AMP-acid ligase II